MSTQFTDAILERDQSRTADLFFRMVRREGRSMGDALSVVTAAEAPFVQVPNHIDVRDGQITLINNDHTILGLRTSANLTPYLPRDASLAAAAAKRLVHPGGARHLEPVAGEISWPLCDDEGHERAAAGLRAGGMERGPGCRSSKLARWMNGYTRT